jgi:hypothetical protein
MNCSVTRSADCCITCCKIGFLLALEIQRGKEGMRIQRHCDTLGATAACTLQLMEKVQQDDIWTEAGLQGDAWFGSVKSAVAFAKKGYNAVLQVKTGRKHSWRCPWQCMDCTWINLWRRTPNSNRIPLQYAYYIAFCGNKGCRVYSKRCTIADEVHWQLGKYPHQRCGLARRNIQDLWK